MTHKPTNFTITDPRTFDGDAYSVASRAVLQSAALAILLGRSFSGVRLMVRNAEMQRHMNDGGSPDPKAWEDGPQAALLTVLEADAVRISQKLNALANAAGYDPKHPPS